MNARRLFIITGDYSGDVHAANVVRELWRMHPETDVAAVGGVNLKELGVELVSDQSQMGRIGFGSVLGARYHFFLGRKILKYLEDFNPDAVLLIDYGVFNLWMASQLKKRGYKVFYFIPPQVWASRRKRIDKIKAFVDHVFCIFPFEEPLYHSHGIPVTYVGHPLVGQLPPPADREAFCKQHGLDPARPIVGLLPGSRRMEIDYLMNPLVASTLPILHEKPQAQFVLSQAASLKPEYFQQRLNDAMLALPINQAPRITVAANQNHALLSVADVLVAASGTVTLEAALYGTPMVIVYKLHPVVYKVGMAIGYAYLPCLGLPNILTDPYNPIVKEHMQEAVNPGEIAKSLMPLFNETSSESQRMRRGFEQIQRQLSKGDAPRNVATGILELMGVENRFPVSETLPLPV